MQIKHRFIPTMYVVLLAVIGLYWIVAVTSYPFLPEKVAVHWSGVVKEPDSYADRAIVAFLLPGITTISLLLLLGPGFAMHSLRSSVAGYFDMFIAATASFLLFLWTGLLAWNIIGKFDFALMAVIATGIYCVVAVVGTIPILTIYRKQRRENGHER